MSLVNISLLAFPVSQQVWYLSVNYCWQKHLAWSGDESDLPSTALGLLVAHQALENIFQFWYKCPWAVFLLPSLVGKGKLVSRRLCWIFPAIVWNTGACHWTTPWDSTPLYGISVKMALVTAKGPSVPQVILTRCFFIFSLMSYCVCNPHYEHEKLHNHLCKWKVALWNSLLHLHL